VESALAARTTTDPAPCGPAVASLAVTVHAAGSGSPSRHTLNGNLTQFVDNQNNHTTNSSYDGADRNTQVNEAWAGGKDTRLGYDPDGNVFLRQTDGKLTNPGNLASDYTGGKTTDFQFDSLDRETATTVHPPVDSDNPCDQQHPDCHDRTFGTTYWPSGDRKQVVKYNAGSADQGRVRTTDSYFYTDDGRLSRRDRRPAGGATDQQDYSYDANANRTKDAHGAYEFNARDQLVKWTHDGKVVTYELNGSGSVTRKCDGASCTAFSYAGGDSERLDSASTDGGPPVHYCYSDAGSSGQAGDLTSIQAGGCGTAQTAGDVSYKYDKFDRLVGSTDQSGAATSYTYDALDRRDTKCNGACSAGTSTDLAYVGLTNALSSEHRGASSPGQPQQRSYDYNSQLERLGTDWKNGSGTSEYRSYLNGPDGTVDGLEASDGTVAANETYKYDPYGSDTTDSSAAPGTTPSGPPPSPSTTLDQAAQDNPFRFQGFYYDAGIKSYDMQAREYQPIAGRFTTPDRFESGAADYALQADPLTQDRYAFAAGNPIDNIESDGHGAPPGEGPNQPLAGGPNRRARIRRWAHRTQLSANVQAQAASARHGLDWPPNHAPVTAANAHPLGGGSDIASFPTTPSPPPQNIANKLTQGDYHCDALSFNGCWHAGKLDGGLSPAGKDVVATLQGPRYIEENGRVVELQQNGLPIRQLLELLGAGAEEGAGSELRAARAGDLGLSTETLAGAESLTASRARELRAALPQASRGRTTLAVGVGKSESGDLRIVVGTNEPGGYLRGVDLNEGELRATGPQQHAEQNVLQAMRENGLTPVTVGASRPICALCESDILRAGATTATPVK
jgi:RHS repeat-associated protein